jgi:hypothetical protein
MSATRSQRYLIARVIHAVAGSVVLLLGLGVLIGSFLPRRSDVPVDLSDPLTYVMAMLDSFPLFAIGGILWWRGCWWRQRADESAQNRLRAEDP